MGLPREQRMTRPGEYAAVRNQGKTCAGRLLMVALLEKPDLGSARFGFTITRKVGNAVVRNKLRRRLREITREAAGEISAGGFVVTIPRFGAATAEFQTLRREWRWAARKLGILPSKSRTTGAESPSAASQKDPA